MKLSCAILDDYQNIALSMADWSAVSEKVEVFSLTQHVNNEDELVTLISHCQIVVLMRERTPFPRKLFARLPKLQCLVTSGMRNASIDLAAASEYRVTVCGTRSLSEPPVEITWALILGLARNIVEESCSLRNKGPWQNSIGKDLYKKRLGLFGLGKIGMKVASIGLAFGMDVVAYSQNLTKEKTDTVGVKLAESKEELLQSSDFVSIHLVLSERTLGWIGENELGLMKPSAYLINTARAPIVDQSALIKALQQKWIAGAGLDVFEEEPLPQDHPFRTLPNVLATPHLGYVTESNYQTYYKEIVENVRAFLSDSPIRKLE